MFGRVTPYARAQFERARVAFLPQQSLCRECERPVRSLDTTCPHCGIDAPVKMPIWICVVIAILAVRHLIALG